jgi:hypothetical protein
MVILSMVPINERRLIMGTPGHSVSVQIKTHGHYKYIDVQVGPHYVVMSGYAEISPDPWGTVHDLPGSDPYDNKEWDTELIIGPVWRDVLQVSPMVAPGKFFDADNDEDDEQGWNLDSGCLWDEVEESGKKRIRLKFKMKQEGETSQFVGIVYHAAATGYVWDWNG